MFTGSNQVEPAFQKHFQITNYLLIGAFFANGVFLAMAVFLMFAEGNSIIRSLAPRYLARTGHARGARTSYTPPARVSFDNFVDLAINRLGQNVGEFGGKGGTCDLEVLASAEKPNGILRMSYDVSLPSSFAGYYHAMTDIELEGLAALSFEIRGEMGGETCSLELNNDNGVRKVSLTGVLPDGCSKKWQKVRIPLACFGTDEEWRHDAAALSFIFENDIDILWRSAVYVRNVGFER